MLSFFFGITLVQSDPNKRRHLYRFFDSRTIIKSSMFNSSVNQKTNSIKFFLRRERILNLIEESYLLILLNKLSLIRLRFWLLLYFKLDLVEVTVKGLFCLFIELPQRIRLKRWFPNSCRQISYFLQYTVKLGYNVITN